MRPSPAYPQVDEQPEPEVAEVPEGSRRLFTRPKARKPIAEPEVREYRDPLPLNSRQIYARGSYRVGQVSVLITRYTRIAGELGIEARRNQQAQEHAILCASLLDTVRAELESKRPKLSLCANLLGMA